MNKSISFYWTGRLQHYELFTRYGSCVLNNRLKRKMKQVKIFPFLYISGSQTFLAGSSHDLMGPWLWLPIGLQFYTLHRIACFFFPPAPLTGFQDLYPSTPSMPIFLLVFCPHHPSLPKPRPQLSHCMQHPCSIGPVVGGTSDMSEGPPAMRGIAPPARCPVGTQISAFRPYQESFTTRQ